MGNPNPPTDKSYLSSGGRKKQIQYGRHFHMAAIFDLHFTAPRGQIRLVRRRIWIPHTQIRL